VAGPLAAIGFFLPGSTAYFVVAFLVQVFLFSTTSPVNAAFMRAVPVDRRASAMAMSIFASHLLGDLWSAALLGLLLDNLPLKVAMLSLPLTFVWAAYIWWPRRREAGPLPAARVHTGT
jgi:predicted MFS family arabinose efflux permease